MKEEGRSQKAEVRSEKPEGRNQKQGVRNEQLEVRSQESGVRRKGPLFRLLTPGIFLLFLLASSFSLLTSSPASNGAASVRTVAGVFTVDTPTITIAGATADTTATPTTAAREAQINWTFGTVAGTYTTCTVQAKTSVDGTNWLTLGTAASVTATTNSVNQWTLIEQAGTTSVTTSTVSSTAALGFGQLTKFTFACSAYGTSAPVTVSVIYR